MNHGQSSSSMAMTRTETTHGPIQWLEQQHNCMAICQIMHWLPDWRCLCWSLAQTTTWWRLLVAHVKEDG